MNQKGIILKQLESMGFEPVELGEAGYLFKYEDFTYLFMPDEDDDNFLRILIPRIFDVTDENRLEVLEAMQETTQILKYVKVCIMYETSVWACYEHYLNSTDNLTDLLEHIIHILETSVHVFYKKINGEEGPNRLLESEDDSELSDEELEAELQRLFEENIDDEELNHYNN